MTMGDPTMYCEMAGTRCIAMVTFAVGGTEEGIGRDIPLFTTMGAKFVCCVLWGRRMYFEGDFHRIC